MPSVIVSPHHVFREEPHDPDLVGWFKFLPRYGVVDILGDTDVTVNGSPTVSADSYPGGEGSMVFDGSTDYLSMGDPDSIEMGTGDYTVSVWFRVPGGSNGTLVGKNHGSTSTWWRLSLSGNKLTGSYDPHTTVHTTSSTQDVNDDRWHHGVVVFDRSGNMSLYLDGVATGSPISIDGINNVGTAELTIGARDSISGPVADYLQFSFSEARIWSRALTQQEIGSHYARGLQRSIGEVTRSRQSRLFGVAHTQTDTAFVPTAAVAVRRKKHARRRTVDYSHSLTKDLALWLASDPTIAGGSNWRPLVSDVNGDFTVTGNPADVWTPGEGLLFDGIADYIDTPDESTAAQTGELTFADDESWTISCVYKGTDTGSAAFTAGATLLGPNDATTHAQFGLNGGVPQYYHFAGSVQYITGSTNCADDEWHLITFVNFPNQTGVIYVDGDQDASGSSTVSSSKFRCRSLMRSSSNYTAGRADHFQVWRRSLSDTDVHELYRSWRSNWLTLRRELTYMPRTVVNAFSIPDILNSNILLY